jgi:hypothetical protein
MVHFLQPGAGGFGEVGILRGPRDPAGVGRCSPGRRTESLQPQGILIESGTARISEIRRPWGPAIRDK